MNPDIDQNAQTTETVLISSDSEITLEKKSHLRPYIFLAISLCIIFASGILTFLFISTASNQKIGDILKDPANFTVQTFKDNVTLQPVVDVAITASKNGTMNGFDFRITSANIVRNYPTVENISKATKTHKIELTNNDGTVFARLGIDPQINSDANSTTTHYFLPISKNNISKVTLTGSDNKTLKQTIALAYDSTTVNQDKDTPVTNTSVVETISGKNINQKTGHGETNSNQSSLLPSFLNDRVYAASEPTIAGDSSKLNVIFIADGYNKSEEEKFENDYSSAVQAFAKMEPYKSYLENFNFSRNWNYNLNSEQEPLLCDGGYQYLDEHPSLRQNQQVIVFLINSNCRSNAGMPYFDPGRAYESGYQSIIHQSTQGEFQGIIMHEFGHSMGVGDQYIYSDRELTAMNPKTQSLVDISPNDNVYTTDIEYEGSNTSYTMKLSDTTPIIPTNKQVIWRNNCLTETQTNNLSRDAVASFPGVAGNIGSEDLRRGCSRHNWWGHDGHIMSAVEQSTLRYDLLSQNFIRDVIKSYVLLKTKKEASSSGETIGDIKLKDNIIATILGIRYINFNIKVTGDLNYVKIYANDKLLHVGILDQLSSAKFENYSVIENNGSKTYDLSGTSKKLTETAVKISDLKNGKNDIKIEAYDGKGNKNVVNFNFDNKRNGSSTDQEPFDPDFAPNPYLYVVRATCDTKSTSTTDGCDGSNTPKCDPDSQSTATGCVRTVMATMTVDSNLSGSATLTGAGDYNENDIAHVGFTINSGYLFDSWSGDCSGKSISQDILMNGNKICTAIFTKEASKSPVTSYTLSLNVYPASAANLVARANGYSDVSTNSSITAKYKPGASITIYLDSITPYYVGDGFAGNCFSEQPIIMNADKSCSYHFHYIGS